MKYIALILFILGCICLLVSKIKEWAYFLGFFNSIRSVDDAHNAKCSYWFTQPVLVYFGAALIIVAGYLFFK